MLSTLQDMLTEDKDAQVVANCMSVLQQVTHCPHHNLEYRCPTQWQCGEAVGSKTSVMCLDRGGVSACLM